jgi:death-on-curing protein
LGPASGLWQAVRPIYFKDEARMNLRSIDPNALLLLYQESYAERGEEGGICDAPKLDAALAYPLNRAVAGEADVAAIAAAYAAGILQYKPFSLGNTRAAFLALELFLYLNGWSLEASEEETERLIQQLSVSLLDEGAVANWIRGKL